MTQTADTNALISEEYDRLRAMLVDARKIADEHRENYIRADRERQVLEQQLRAVTSMLDRVREMLRNGGM